MRQMSTKTEREKQKRNSYGVEIFVWKMLIIIIKWKHNIIESGICKYTCIYQVSNENTKETILYNNRGIGELTAFYLSVNITFDRI